MDIETGKRHPPRSTRARTSSNWRALLAQQDNRHPTAVHNIFPHLVDLGTFRIPESEPRSGLIHDCHNTLTLMYSFLRVDQTPTPEIGGHLLRLSLASISDHQRFPGVHQQFPETTTGNREAGTSPTVLPASALLWNHSGIRRNSSGERGLQRNVGRSQPRCPSIDHCHGHFKRRGNRHGLHTP